MSRGQTNCLSAARCLVDEVDGGQLITVAVHVVISVWWWWGFWYQAEIFSEA